MTLYGCAMLNCLPLDSKTYMYNVPREKYTVYKNCHIIQKYLKIFLKFYLFLNLFIFGCIGSFVAARRLSLFAVSRGYSSLQCAGFSLQWPLDSEPGLQARRPQ